MKASEDLLNIQKSLSRARLSRYERVTNNLDRAIDLYLWNIQISSALFECLSICEVVIRNAISQSMTAIYGTEWTFNSTYLASLPRKSRETLEKANNDNDTVDKIIPELPFVFWQSMFTARFDNEIWQNQLAVIMPNANHNNIRTLRRGLYTDLDNIRKLRNRIAHHEPIFNRRLQADYNQIIKIIRYCNSDVANWLESWQRVTTLLTQKPN